ncbi:MAG: DUF488 family protein [Haloarculaceae archaeon]
MSESAGSVRETYVAAIQHDLVDLSGEELLAGVVRKPMPWIHGAIDANYPDLGPPVDLLEETKEREEDFKRQGICDAEALNAAWEDTDFAARYRSYLRDSAAADEALDALDGRLDAGQDVVLVCYESDEKRCHRHLLVEELRGRR